MGSAARAIWRRAACAPQKVVLVLAVVDVPGVGASIDSLRWFESFCVVGLSLFRFHKGSRSPDHFCQRPWLSTYRCDQACHPPTQRTTPLCSPCSQESTVTCACGSTPRDWAVSIGSQIRQSKVITLAHPRARPRFSLNTEKSDFS